MKRRVAFFVNSLYGGGAEKVLQTLLRFLDKQKFDVTLYSLHRNQLDDSYPSEIVYKYIYGHGKWTDLIKTFVYKHFAPSVFYRLFVHGTYDTEVAFIEGYSTRIVSGSTNPNSKKIAWVHIDLKNYPWTLQKGIYKSLKEEKDAYRRFDKVICVSNSVENVMKESYGLINTGTIYNPIDVAFINQKAQDPVDFTPSDGFNIVSVGRLVPQKGFDLLIPIIARLRKDGLNIHLYILGEGEDGDKLRDMSVALKVQDSIEFLGYKTNPYAYISKMDLFVCSSRAEGFSLVIAEALSMGIPVISTNCSGPNELLGIDSRYGLLCNDYEDLYLKIKEAATKPVLLEELHKKAIERKTILNVEESINQVYELLW